MRFCGFFAVAVLCWPASSLGQNPTLDLLATVHGEESLVAASRPLFFDLRPLDTAALRTALSNSNPYVRWIAAMTLAGYNVVPSPELVIPVLVDAIKEGEPGVRKLAFQQLGYLSQKSGYADICAPVIDDDIITGLRDPAYEVHRGALEALGRCPSLPVSIAAREIAESRGRDSAFRLFMIRNLERRGPQAKEATDVLIAALDDELPDVRRAAAEALRSAGVDPQLYVPPILDDLRNGTGGRPGVTPADKLVEVAPAAAQWAPDIIEIFRNERHPYVRERLRHALNRTGVPQAQQTASADEMKDSLAKSAPAIAFVAATVLVSVLLVKSGWGVLLGFLLPALPLIAGSVIAHDSWEWLPVIIVAPVFHVAGAITGFLCSAGASDHKRTVGLIGAGIAGVALVVNVLLIVVLYFGLAPLGAG